MKSRRSIWWAIRCESGPCEGEYVREVAKRGGAFIFPNPYLFLKETAAKQIKMARELTPYKYRLVKFKMVK